MRKSLDLDQEGCYLQAGKKGCLEECGFNATAKTIFIVHGWTVICLALHFLFIRVHLAKLHTPQKVKHREDVGSVAQKPESFFFFFFWNVS